MTAVQPTRTASLVAAASARPPGAALYTPGQKKRRDESIWTIVQGVLAPLQFLVFLVSLGLVLRYLVSGEGLAWATGSVLLKTAVLYLIMLTGCIWEKAVFGVYLFAPAFYWEDVFSMLVLALHTAYVASVIQGWMSPGQQMVLALAAYAAYVINAGQFLWKLRAARLQAQQEATASAVEAGAQAPAGQTRAAAAPAGESMAGAWAGGVKS